MHHAGCVGPEGTSWNHVASFVLRQDERAGCESELVTSSKCMATTLQVTNAFLLVAILATSIVMPLFLVVMPLLLVATLLVVNSYHQWCELTLTT